MRISYKHNRLEKGLIGANALTAAVVVASFVSLFGFHRPLLAAWILYTIQVVCLVLFVAEKIVRLVGILHPEPRLRDRQVTAQFVQSLSPAMRTRFAELVDRAGQ